MRRRDKWLGTAVLAAATATAVGVAGFAHADPLDWQVVAVPELGEQARLEAVDAVAADNVWAVGSAGPKGDRHGVASNWDGNQWRQVKLPGDMGYLSDVRAFAADDVWTVGSDSAHHYDGSAWTTTTLPVPTDGWMMSMDGAGGDDLWAVGNTGVVGGGPDGYAFLTHFDGKKWSKVDIPVPEGITQFSARQVNAVAADNVWVVGSLFTSGGEKPLLAHWDGAEWTVTDPAELPAAAGTAVAELHGQTWMVGLDVASDDPTEGSAVLLRHVDGKWTEVATPNDTAWFYSLTPDGRGGLVAGGYTQETSATLRWDGQTATIEPGPVKDQHAAITDLDTVADPDSGTDTGVVWAVGDTNSQLWSAHS